MSNQKTKVAVLMGGSSREHEVSLNTGKNVLKHIDESRYESIPVVISKNEQWDIHPRDLKKQADVVFIAMHGSFGEDGKVQHDLERHNIPYTGSDPHSSALGMNKFFSLRLLSRHGLDVPHSLHVSKYEWHQSPETAVDKIASRLEPPWVVKPNREGSSVDIEFVDDRDGLRHALYKLLESHRDLIAQEKVEGRELTCGVLDHGTPESAYPLVPTEIVPQMDHFFDYDSKYKKGGAQEITPARLPNSFLEEARRLARRAHQILGCSGMSRTDFMLTPDKKFVVLEVNTIPGLTNTSLLPQGARDLGISFSELLHRIIQSALR